MTSTLRFLASVPLLMALALQTAQAQPMGPPGSTYPLAPYQVLAMVRSNGFEPLSRPLRRGAVYWLQAISRRGQDVALTVDAVSGRILSVARHCRSKRRRECHGAWFSSHSPRMLRSRQSELRSWRRERRLEA